MRSPGHLAAMVVLAGCAGAPTPAPELYAVTPSQAAAGADIAVEIAGANLTARVVTDFVRPGASVVDAAFTARLFPHADQAAGVALLDVRLAGPDGLTATVPAGLDRGVYDLEVLAPGGRSLRLESAFRVVASAETVAAFRLEPIGPQRAGSPFAVSLAAVDAAGRVVDGFDGTVALSDASGTLTPEATGPFVLGRARVLVTVAAPIAADALTVADALGHTATSEPFEVKSGLAVAVAFRSPPRAVAAGACSPAVEVGLEDEFGAPAQAESPLTFLWSAGPLDAVSFFVDPACATPASHLALATGEAGGSVYFRADRSGAPVLRVESDALPSAAQVQAVSPGSPERLGFSTPALSVAAGACSGAVEVQALDAFGNPSPVAETLPLVVTASPPGAVTFYSDPGCAASLTGLTVAAQAASTTFYFEAAVAGVVELEVAAALGTVSQLETITP